jgi:hypothetical protein
MTDQVLRAPLITLLGRIAPDVVASSNDLTLDMREEREIASSNFLTLITALERVLPLDMPEADMRSYAQVR